jgi:hypothetical protein
MMATILSVFAAGSVLTALGATAATARDLHVGVLSSRERRRALGALLIAAAIAAEMVRAASGTLPSDGVATASVALVVCGYTGLTVALRLRRTAAAGVPTSDAAGGPARASAPRTADRYPLPDARDR